MEKSQILYTTVCPKYSILTKNVQLSVKQISDSLENVRNFYREWLKENSSKRDFVSQYEKFPRTIVCEKNGDNDEYSNVGELIPLFCIPKLKNADDLRQQFLTVISNGDTSLRTSLLISCDDVFLGEIETSYPITFRPATGEETRNFDETNKSGLFPNNKLLGYVKTENYIQHVEDNPDIPEIFRNCCTCCFSLFNEEFKLKMVESVLEKYKKMGIF